MRQNKFALGVATAIAVTLAGCGGGGGRGRGDLDAMLSLLGLDDIHQRQRPEVDHGDRSPATTSHEEEPVDGIQRQRTRAGMH